MAARPRSAGQQQGSANVKRRLLAAAAIVAMILPVAAEAQNRRNDRARAVTSKGGEPGKRTDDMAGATPEDAGRSGGKGEDGGK